MRILHIGKFYPPFAGGMEHFLADLIAAQQAQGIPIAALVHQHDGSGSENRPSVADKNSPSPLIYRAPCHGRLLYAPVSPQFPLWLRHAICYFQPDILHFHLPNTSAFWAMVIPAARNIPWVIHWHADVVASRIDRRLALAYRVYRPFEQRLLAQSRAIIATSPPYLTASAPLKPWREKCHVIPLGLNPDRIPDPDAPALTRAEQIWNKAPLKLLAVGRLTYYKGHDILIRAAARVAGLRLVIVGKGENIAGLKALIQTLKLEHKVLLAGFQAEADLNALFATCDAVCLPSLERTEAFGLVLLEAMRFQKPVIASDIPGSGVGWVVRQGGHGLLVPPGDIDAWVHALSEFSRLPDHADLGRKGVRALQETFHIRQVAEQTLSLYETVCGAAR